MVSSDSGSSRSLAIASRVPGDGGPDGRGNAGAGVAPTGTAAEGGADDGLQKNVFRILLLLIQYTCYIS